jgi:uncharacterized membrane-anchored protein
LRLDRGAPITQAMTRQTQIVILAAALVATPAAYAAWSEIGLRRGTHVLLRVRPVDPHDPFRGEYVALTYPESALPFGRSFRDGARVFVPLRRRADGVSIGGAPRSVPPRRGVFLRGRVDDWQIRFGIERFYVREGTARRYEQAIFARRLYADVVVDDDGDPHLSKLVIR